VKRVIDSTDFLSIVVSRYEIETVNLSTIQNILINLLTDRSTMLSFFERVELGVSGYENDPRELWNIPEVKNYFKQLDEKFPYWFFFLSKQGHGLKLIAFCCIDLIQITNKQVWLEPATMEIFYQSHFSAMNQVCEIAGVSDEENEKLTERVFNYFSS